jgi:HAD superfamily hydrolase (TIGR01549 family)
MFKGFVFDLDGTLVDSKLDFAALAKRLEIPMGSPILELVATWPTDRQAWAMKVIHDFEAEGAAASEPIPGAFDFLRFLQGRAIPTALFTRNSKAVMRATLQKHNLDFAIALAREDVPPKPKPDGLHLIQQQWRIPTGQILYVGDYLYDLQAGIAASMPTAVYAPQPPDFSTEGAFLLFRDYAELNPYIEQ